MPMTMHSVPDGPAVAGSLLALALAGCATRAPAPQSDGAEARPPLDPMQVPDAVPVLGADRAPAGRTRPYEVLGETYTPLPPDAVLSERGLASWYGRQVPRPYHEARPRGARGGSGV